PTATTSRNVSRNRPVSSPPRRRITPYPPRRFWRSCGSGPPPRAPRRRGYPSTARKINDALVPPKPNELERTVLISRLRGLWGTRSIQLSTEGLSRLSVGGATPSRMASTQKIASTAPAAPRRWPIADLVDDIDRLFDGLSNRRSTARSSISSPSGVEVPWALM